LTSFSRVWSLDNGTTFHFHYLAGTIVAPASATASRSAQYLFDPRGLSPYALQNVVSTITTGTKY